MLDEDHGAALGAELLERIAAGELDAVRSLLEEYGLKPNQAYGQNFLIDPNLIRRIVRLAAVGPDSNVVEIGGGTGTLTAALAATGARVVVYEIDAGLVRVLRHTVGDLPNVQLRHGDAAEVPLDLARYIDHTILKPDATAEMIDEWCAGDGRGRLIPLTIVPLWDAELAAAEVRRCAKKGSYAVAQIERNMSIDEDGNFVNIMDAGWIEQVVVEAAKAQGIGVPKYIKPGAHARFSTD